MYGYENGAIVKIKESLTTAISQKITEKKFAIESEYVKIYIAPKVLIKLCTDYEYYELDKKIENTFVGYEFYDDVGRGRQEIRIEINRCQSNLTNDWGRPVENRLDETKYLIRRRPLQKNKFSPRVETLFLDEERDYYINIIPGINRANQKKGFLTLESFDKLSDEDINKAIFIERLHENYSDAFWTGFSRLEQKAEEEFKEYLKEKRKIERKKTAKYKK